MYMKGGNKQILKHIDHLYTLEFISNWQRQVMSLRRKDIYEFIFHMKFFCTLFGSHELYLMDSVRVQVSNLQEQELVEIR